MQTIKTAKMLLVTGAALSDLHAQVVDGGVVILSMLNSSPVPAWHYQVAITVSWSPPKRVPLIVAGTLYLLLPSLSKARLVEILVPKDWPGQRSPQVSRTR